MKKHTLNLTFVLSIITLAPAFAAGPYSANLNADVFDSTPDSTPTPNQNTDPYGGKQIKDAINLLLGTTYTQNAQADSLQFHGEDSSWVDMSLPGQEARFLLVGINTGYNNTLNVYDPATPSSKINIFGQSYTGMGLRGNGSVSNPFTAAASPFAPGDVFNFNLTRVPNDRGVDSDPFRNSDYLDHMMTYRLPGLEGNSVYVKVGSGPAELYTFQQPYLLAWEDTFRLGDQDYNDTLVLVDRIAPVPEPMTLALLGGGMLAALGLRRKQIK